MKFICGPRDGQDVPIAAQQVHEILVQLPQPYVDDRGIRKDRARYRRELWQCRDGTRVFCFVYELSTEQQAFDAALKLLG